MKSPDVSETRILASYVTDTRLEDIPLGNLGRPLSDRQLDDKFRDQGVLALPEADLESLITLCWRIDELGDVNDVVAASVRREARAGASARVTPASRRA
jgi:hypothetical protein